MKEKFEPYLVIRDTLEKKGWTFPKDEYCAGMECTHLHTGDYSVQGYEDIFSIERKKSTAEIGQNIFEERFRDELERLAAMKFPYMIFEFTYEDVYKFPIGSGIPPRLWHKLRMTSKLMRSTLAEYTAKYKIPIFYAGKRGPEIAIDLFKTMVRYGRK